jgi:polyphosphate kinase
MARFASKGDVDRALHEQDIVYLTDLVRHADLSAEVREHLANSILALLTGKAKRPAGRMDAKPDDATGSVDEGGEPKLKRKDYEKALRGLQTELCSVQDWVRQTGQRIIVVFEGRDAAGKGGTIRAMTERVSPRTFRLVALPAPSDREKSQMYVQRYLAHFPAAGEIVIFDRSWYNRAGVEYVMGFCTKEQHQRFLQVCPEFEKHIVDNGIILIKYWLEVSNKEQKRRFEARVEDPLRQWKLSDMDLPSRERWYDYSRARDMMLEATDTDYAPWHIVRSDDKRRARLNLISHFLGLLPYEAPTRKKVKLPNRDKKNTYDDAATIEKRRWIGEKY